MTQYNEKNMDTLANHFGFTQTELAKLLYDVNAFIAGSAPLNVFTQSKLFDGLDLDIFLRIPYNYENKYGASESKFKCHYYPYEELAKERINNVLYEKGYKKMSQNYNYQSENKPTKDIEYMKCALSHFIKNIETYQNNNKKIQIITIFDCTIDEFMDTFDLNICKMVIVGDFEGNLNLYTQHLSKDEIEEIRNKEMYIIHPFYPANLEKRIQKYLNRGFIWVKSSDKTALTENTKKIGDYLYEAFDNHVVSYEEFIEYKKNKSKKHIEEVEEVNEEYDSEVDEEPIVKQKTSKKHIEEVDKKFNEVFYSENKKPSNIKKTEPEIIVFLEDLNKGVEYMNTKNLLNYCLNYTFTDNDIKNKKICLDEFYLINDDNYEDNIDENINIKWDLNEIVKSCSCYGLSVYIYQLIEYIKEMPIISVEIKENKNDAYIHKIILKNNTLIKISYYYKTEKYDNISDVYIKCAKHLEYISDNL